jgi:hypothetical protein
MPFMHSQERKLGEEQAETLLHIGHCAREFNLSRAHRSQLASRAGEVAEVNDEDRDVNHDEEDGIDSDEEDEKDEDDGDENNVFTGQSASYFASIR